MKHLKSPLFYWPLAILLATIIVLAGIGAVPPPPIQRNIITTNTPAVVTFGGASQASDTILGWDTVDNQFVDMFIGANLTYTHATHTLSGGAGGSGVSVASQVPGLLITNGGNTLVTITPNGNGFTNLNGTNIVGNLTNNTSGNAATATKALFVDSILTNSLPGTNLTGTYIGAGLTMNTARILGRTTAGVGQVEELSAGSGVTIAGGLISATGSQTPWLQDEDAAGFSGTNGGKLIFTNFVTAVQGVGSTNDASAPGASIFGAAVSSSTNKASGFGAMIDGVSTNGGYNLASGTGARVMGNADSSTNQASGAGASVIGDSTNGSYNLASGVRSRIVGSAVDASKNTASGSDSAIYGATLGGGLSQVSGAGSILLSEISSSGGGNFVSAANSFGLMLSTGGTNDLQTGGSLRALNQLFGTALNPEGRNQISSASVAFVGNRLFGYANQGTNLLTSTANSGGGLMFASAETGLNELRLSGQNGMMFAQSSASGTNLVSGNGGFGLMSMRAADGLNALTASGSMLLGIVGTGSGSNINSGASSVLIGAAQRGGFNQLTGQGFLFGYADGGTNKLQGTGSMLFGTGDTNTGSLVSTGDRSFTFGSGGTNTSSDSFAAYLRGNPVIFGETNRLGVMTQTPRSTLDVNGTTTHAGTVTNENLTINTIMGVDGGKREVSVALSGLTFDGVTLTATGGGGGVYSNQTITIAGTANQITSSAGAQDLSANRTWTLSTPSDFRAPGFLTVTSGQTNSHLTASLPVGTDVNKALVSLTLDPSITLAAGKLYATNGTVTATNLYFPLLIETNAGAVNLLDLPVSSAATAGTEQSYTFNVAGTAMLKLQRSHSSAGATTNAVIKTMGGFATNTITDFVIGTRYTNTTQRAWVSASAQLTAAVAGTAIVTLYCEQFQSVTNKLTVSAGPLASLITVEPLTMITSPQAVFYFLDEKTGAGASVGIVAGTCSRIEL